MLTREPPGAVAPVAAPGGGQAGEAVGGDGRAASARYDRPAVEGGVPVGGEGVEDGAVEDVRGADAGAGDGIEQGDARSGSVVDLAGDGGGLAQGAGDARIAVAGGAAPAQQRPVDAVGGEEVGGQVDTAPVEVLADVAEEVGELEGDAERGGVRGGLLPGDDGAEHGQHLEADDGGGAVRVAAQRGEVRVVGDGEVAAHGGHEVVEVPVVDGVPADGVGEGVHHRLLAGAFAQSGGQPLVEVVEGGGPFAGGGGGAEVVDDVVGVAGEAVEAVDGRAPLGGEQPGGEEVRPAVAGVEGAAGAVGGAQGGVGDTGGVEFAGAHRVPPVVAAAARRGRAGPPGSPVTRAAASLPEISTVGMPTPGVVPQPASTALAVPRTRLRGRNGPVWAKVWAAEKGLPAAWPWAVQSTG